MTTAPDYMETERVTPIRQPSKPAINVKAPRLELIDAATDALRASRDEYGNPRIYRRGKPASWVRIAEDSPRDLNRESLLTELAHAAQWYKRTAAGDEVSCDPPRKVADALLAESPMDLPEIVGVSRLPIIRPDGSLHTARGYDETSQMFLTVDWSKLEITNDAPGEIAARLLAPFCDFEFKDDSARSACLSAMLSPLARHAYRGVAPFMLFDANVRGCGKTMLANAIGYLATGALPSPTTLPTNEEERRKKITTLVRAAAEFAIFDNVNCEIGGQSLEAAITSERWCDRVLGQSEQVDVDNRTVWIATANNATMTTDMRRRTLYVRLESQHENPESRSDFTHGDFFAHLGSIRRRWIADAVSLLSRYLRAGCPCDVSPWGSFERWSEVVRGAIVWAGLTDPIQARAELNDYDPSREALIALFDAWPGEPGEPIQTGTLCVDPKEFAYSPLLRALEAIDADPTSARSIGRALSSHRDRWVEGRRIVWGRSNGRAHYKLEVSDSQ